MLGLDHAQNGPRLFEIKDHQSPCSCVGRCLGSWPQRYTRCIEETMFFVHQDGLHTPTGRGVGQRLLPALKTAPSAR